MESLWVNTGAGLKTLLQRARRLGVATSLDMSLPDADSPAGKADWQALLAATLPEVDIFVPSIEEALFMLEPENYARLVSGQAGSDGLGHAIPADVFLRLAERILALGVKVLMIKAGSRGAYIRTGDVEYLNRATSLALPAAAWSQRSLWVDPFPIDAKRVQNACGAGDCSVAGFLTAILNGATLDQAGRLAMLAGRDNLYSVHGYLPDADWHAMENIVAREFRREHAAGRTTARRKSRGQPWKGGKTIALAS